MGHFGAKTGSKPGFPQNPPSPLGMIQQVVKNTRKHPEPTGVNSSHQEVTKNYHQFFICCHKLPATIEESRGMNINPSTNLWQRITTNH